MGIGETARSPGPDPRTPRIPRVGVEEEFLVVDPVTRAAVPKARPVLHRATRRLGGRVCGEITEYQVETRTDPCRTVEEVHAQLVEARGWLAEAAAAEGLRVMASGTPVLGQVSPPPITTGPRQERGVATFRGLHDDAAICALHVHVELADQERALMVSNHLRPHLPVLVALTANSPYWSGRDTGYASWRTIIWRRWPVAGPPPYFTSTAHYDQTVASLRDAGAIVDAGTLFWDVRPSAHLPTLEIRATDTQAAAEDAAALAALVRALVAAALPAVDRGEPGPAVPADLLRLAYWRAARDGLSGKLIDLPTARPRPATELAGHLLDTATPALADHGDLDRVTAWLRRLADEGDGATRQRRAADERGGLAAVVDRLVARTAPAGAREQGAPA